MKKQKSPSRKVLTPIEKFLALSDAQKDAEVAKYEKGIDPKEWRPLNAAQRKQWKRVKAKMGRPRVGAGAKAIAVTIERDLLKRADRYAKDHGLKRAELIALALEDVIRRAG